jgi:hypothetical protein
MSFVNSPLLDPVLIILKYQIDQLVSGIFIICGKIIS